MSKYRVYAYMQYNIVLQCGKKTNIFMGKLKGKFEKSCRFMFCHTKCLTLRRLWFASQLNIIF